MNISNINPYVRNKYYEPMYKAKNMKTEKKKDIVMDSVEISNEAYELYKKIKAKE